MSAIVCVDCRRELSERDVVEYIERKPNTGKRQRRVYRHPACLTRRARGYYDTLRRKVLLAPERRAKITRDRTVTRLWTNSDSNEKKLCLALGEPYTPETRLSRDTIEAVLRAHDADEVGIVGFQVHGLVRKRTDAPLSLENVQVLPLREIRDFIHNASLSKHRTFGSAVPLVFANSQSADSNTRLEDVAPDD